MKTLLFIAAGLLASTVMAAADGTLTIQGTVADVSNIVITDDLVNLKIVAGETQRKVGSALETSNSADGYNIQIKSANSNQLINTSNSAFKTSYTLTYKHAAGAVTKSLTTAFQEFKRTTVGGNALSDTSEILVDVTPYASAPGGRYEDTVTIAIAGN